VRTVFLAIVRASGMGVVLYYQWSKHSS